MLRLSQIWPVVAPSSWPPCPFWQMSLHSVQRSLTWSWWVSSPIPTNSDAKLSPLSVCPSPITSFLWVPYGKSRLPSTTCIISWTLCLYLIHMNTCLYFHSLYLKEEVTFNFTKHILCAGFQLVLQSTSITLCLLFPTSLIFQPVCISSLLSLSLQPYK